MDDPATAPFIDQRAQPEVEAAPIAAPHGHGTVVRSAWLDVPALLDAQRAELLRDGALSEVEVAEVREDADAVHIRSHSAPVMMWCNGAFSDVDGLVPVKGEGLTVRIPGLQLTRMVHRGVFLLPTPALGPEVYRVGATFKWDVVWEGATAEGRDWLLAKVARITDRPVEVLDQWAGVRPASKDRRPLLGCITARQAVLNGLGSRGVLLAPWCAQHLAAHLFDGLALDPEVDVARMAR